MTAWIEELEWLDKKAAGGPWRVGEMDGVPCVIWSGNVYLANTGGGIADARLIVAMRNALPQLLAAARLADEMNAYMKLGDELDRLADVPLSAEIHEQWKLSYDRCRDQYNAAANLVDVALAAYREAVKAEGGG